MGQRVTVRRAVGDEAAYVHVREAVGEVDPGGITLGGKQVAPPEVDAALEAAEPAGRARAGERLILIVDLLAEKPRPV